MRGPVRDTAAMIAGMAPVLRQGRFAFVETQDAALLARAFAVVREDEGTTAILPVAVAADAGLDTSLPMACITLTVQSALDGVGLTAAVSQALAAAGIPCNVVAGARHDHLFVPAARAEAALSLLQRRAAPEVPPLPDPVPGITIRPATPADDDAIWAILKPAIEAGDSFAADPGGGRAGAFAYWRPPGAENFVAEIGSRIVGTCYLKPNHAGGGAHVANAGYCTTPEARGRGIARALLAHSLQEARTRGFDAMQFNFVVETNTRAIDTWVQAGFDVAGRLPGAFRHPREGRVDALVMHRRL
ncbi:ACT domain-containing protein [Rhodosalinus sp.]|uniref:ACT domain-containing protein n=1 Tax=Rhodosalinus sp. TaxID=2047741 RepID=UPI00397C896C